MNDISPHASAAQRLDPSVEAIIDATTVSYRDDEWVVDCEGTRLSAPSQRGLVHALSGHLYATRHAGIAPGDAEEFVPALQQDAELEQRLAAVSAFRTRRERLSVVEHIDGIDGAIVLLQGLRVFVPGDQVLSQLRTQIDAEMPTLAPRLSVGFLFYTARIGPGRGGRPLRVYRRIGDADEAVDVWRRFTDWAEREQIPLRAKVLSQSWGYPRTDGLVVYLPADAWHRLDDLAEVLETPEDVAVSAFAHPVARGVTVAWEPHDLSAAGSRTSFGEHRAAAVARGIVAAAGQGDVRVRVRSELVSSNVDPIAVYRNLDSPSLDRWVARAGRSARAQTS